MGVSRHRQKTLGWTPAVSVLRILVLPGPRRPKLRYFANMGLCQSSCLLAGDIPGLHLEAGRSSSSI